MDALGDLLGAAARAIHDRVQAPLAICGQSVLGAATLAAQAHAEPASLYLVTVAKTGAGKSASDREAGWPVREYEQRSRTAYDLDSPSYINDKTAWDKARDVALKQGKGDLAKIKATLNALGPAPTSTL